MKEEMKNMLAVKKTMSFALLHMLVAFTVGFVVTGSVMVGSMLALIEPAVNTVAYFLHEKAWHQKTEEMSPEP